MTNAPTSTSTSPPPVAHAHSTPNGTMAHSADDRAEAAPHVPEPRLPPVTDMTGVQYKPDDDTLRLVAESCARKVDALLAREPETKLLRAMQQQVRIAMGVIEEAMGRYRPEELSLSYNGGKDCLVLLVLLLAVMPKYYSTSTTSSASNSTATSTSTVGEATELASDATRSSSQDHNPSSASAPTPTSTPSATKPPFPRTLQSVYIVSPHPFPEVDSFVDASVATYALDLARFPAPMKPALENYLAARPAVRAVFVGTRRTDPHGELLSHFDMTDGDWPRFMRVHPVIDWHYAEIWAFIREIGLEYCSLYDKGYTSLGGTTDTHPNPALRRRDDPAESYRPAYELIEDYEERLGRDK